MFIVRVSDNNIFAHDKSIPKSTIHINVDFMWIFRTNKPVSRKKETPDFYVGSLINLDFTIT